MLNAKKHFDFYRENGFVIVPDFLSPEQLHAAQQDLRDLAPGWIEYCQGETTELPPVWPTTKNGNRSITIFPYTGSTLNEISVDEQLSTFATEMTGGVAMYCEQSHLTFKYKGHPADVDQAMHCDYGNHTLAYPPNDPKYWQTAYLLYFTDVTLNHAPTAVCSWKHYPEEVRAPAFYSKKQLPEIYENEVKVTVPAGGLLVYSMRTFHRGTPFLAEGGRVGQFITYAPAAWKWLGIVGWSKEAIRPEFAKWVASATPEARTLLGFPEIGHQYWCDETISGVAKRFPEMDMSPYITGMRSASS